MSVLWRPAVVVNPPVFQGGAGTVLSVVDSWVKPETVPLRELESDVRAVVEELGLQPRGVHLLLLSARACG